MGKDLSPGLTANGLYCTVLPPTFSSSHKLWKFQVWLGPFSLTRQGSFDPKYGNWGEGKTGSSKWMIVPAGGWEQYKPGMERLLKPYAPGRQEEFTDFLPVSEALDYGGCGLFNLTKINQ